MKHSDKILFLQNDLMILGEMTRGKIDFLKNRGVIKSCVLDAVRYTYYDALKVLILKELKKVFPLRKAQEIIYSISAYENDSHTTLDPVKKVLLKANYIVFGEINNVLMHVRDITDIEHLLDEHVESIYKIPDIEVEIPESFKYIISGKVMMNNTHVINLKAIRKELDNFGKKEIKNYTNKKEYSLSMR